MRRLATVLFLALALAPSLAAAQSATPSASPTSKPCLGIFCGSTGMTAKATRRFDQPGVSLFGLQEIEAVVAVFDSNDHATAAMRGFLPNLVVVLHESATLDATVKAASVRAMGDESLALIGDVPKTLQRPASVYAIVATRVGAEVRVAIGGGLLPSDPIKQLADVLEASLQHHISRDAVAKVAAGMMTGGAYAALPQLSDLPEGFTFTKDDITGDDFPKG